MGKSSKTPAPSEGALARCLALMLDEVDYGMLLVDGVAHVHLSNHVARTELGSAHPLHVAAGQLVAHDASSTAELHEAITAAAARGNHRLLILGEAAQRIVLTVRPLGADLLPGAPAVAVVMGRRTVVENLSMQSFARARRLTPAETRVLEGLCAGVPPTRIAEQLGVQISTVRTQIGGIRDKTGARSIRELVRLVAVLPPMVPALRDPDTSGGAR